MSTKRDHPEEALLGWFIAGIVAFIVGLFLGKRAAEAQQKTIQLSETLELDPARTYAPPPKPNRIHQVATWYGILLVINIGFMAVAGLFAVFWHFTDPVIALVMTLLMTLMFGALVGWFWVKSRQSRAPLEPDIVKFAVQPLDLAHARAYRITLPKTTEWQPQTAGRFMQDILLKFGWRLTFQIIAEEGRIVWRILDLRRAVPQAVVIQAVQAFYPEAEIVCGELQEVDYTPPFYRYISTLKQPFDFLVPILRADKLTHFDPLVHLTHEMGTLGRGERVIYTLFVADMAKFVYDQAEELLTVPGGLGAWKWLTPAGWFEAGYEKQMGEPRVEKYLPDDQKRALEKLNNAICQCLLVIQVDAPTEERVRHISRLDTHMFQFQGDNAGLLDLAEQVLHITTLQQAADTDVLGLLGSWLTNKSTQWRKYRLLLDTKELAALWHLPHASFTAPSIHWSRGKRVPLPADMRGKSEGVYLGDNVFGGRRQPVYMLPADRAGHMIIVGKTGMGKSTLLHNLIRQDIAAGRGVALIDPSPKDKNLVPRILQGSIPRERERDVVVLDLSDRDTPPPFNILSVPTNVRRRDAVASVRAIFERVYGSTFSDARMGRTFGMALHTVMADPQATVRDVARVVWDLDYREQLLDHVTSAGALDFWERFATMSPAQQDSYFEPILGRVEALYDNEFLYPAVCHPDPLNLGTYIQQGKIILIALCPPENVGLAPSEQALLGSILVSQFQLAVMAQRPSKRYFLYVDEAQHFVTTALPELFNEARGQHLSLTLSNQFLKQLVGSTLHAIMGNVGAIAAFQVGPDDAHTLASDIMKPHFSSYDLTHMEVHHTAISMRYNNKQQEPFSLEGHDGPSTLPDAAEREAELRALSRQQYTPWSRQEILAWLDNRYPRKRREKKSRTDEEQFSEPL